MKLSILTLATILMVLCPVRAQEVPKGVNYKTAPEAVNALAKSGLERALASDSLPSDFFGEVTVVGPMLWSALKPSADNVMLKTMPVLLMVPGSPGFTAEGKRLLTDDQRKVFWKSLHKQFAVLKGGKIRKGKAAEIAYYWSTIPFDIVEPFWVIEAGDKSFITHFQVADGKPGLFWIDLVGDLQKLKP